MILLGSSATCIYLIPDPQNRFYYPYNESIISLLRYLDVIVCLIFIYKYKASKKMHYYSLSLQKFIRIALFNLY